MVKQVRLIEKAYNYINDKLNDMASESGLTTMIHRNESRKKAATNLRVKINRKMRRLNKNNFISMINNVIAGMIYVSHRENRNPMKPCKSRNSKLMSTGLTYLVPLSDKCFTLREDYLYIYNKGMKVNVFNLATDEVINQNHPKLLCGRSNVLEDILYSKQRVNYL